MKWRMRSAPNAGPAIPSSFPDLAPPRTYDAELEVARRAAAAASDILLGYFRTGITPDLKGPGDLVTVADHESEERVRDLIRSAFPDDVVVGEEGAKPAEADLQGSRRWYVDPLDGTTNFVKGQPRWAVSVAFCDDDDAFGASAIERPCVNEEYSACRGQGAYLNGNAIVRTDDPEFDSALVLLGPIDGHNGVIREIAAKALSIRVTGSTVSDLADLAVGRGDLHLGRNQGRWDLAAGTLIAREAGLVVTDLAGATCMGPTDNLLVAPPTVHGKMLMVLKEGDGNAVER